MIKIILLIFFTISIFAKDSFVYESQPNIIFNYKHLTKKEQSLALQVDFNNAVLFLEKKEYLKAIHLFKKTAKILKIPSFLNIGIGYYKLHSTNNAYLYLKKIYDIKEAAMYDLYSYISASYYLYLITNDRKYISTILNVIKKSKPNQINSHVKRLVADTYIILKKYKKAIKIIESMKEKDKLKLAVLYIKTRNYTKANINLIQAYQRTKDDKLMNQILWLQVFKDLKANRILQLQDILDTIQQRKRIFHINRKMPLKIFFNRDKYTAKQHLDRVMKLSTDRKIDMIFYFAPFIFIDKKEIYNDSTLGFVLKNQNNINSLDNMIKYNKDFINIVKKDPIIRTQMLQKLIDKKYNAKSYEYYNLGLCYAQIDNFIKANKYFKKAYDLNHANKLYSAMTLISALRGSVKLRDTIKDKIVENVQSNVGDYQYLGKYIYKLIYNPKLPLKKIKVDYVTKRSIFIRALYFLEHINKDGILADEPLLKADVKDPLVYLFRNLAKQKNENQYEYISRLQDTIPKVYNDDFLKGSFIITQYYMDLLKGLGIFNLVDFNIAGNHSPSYQLTKAFVLLFDGYAKQSSRIIQNLQIKYNLNDKYTYYLAIACYLELNDYSNASATLGMLQFELHDNDAKFLNGVELIQNLKIYSAKQSFRKKFKGFLIDFKLVGIDDFLESL